MLFRFAKLFLALFSTTVLFLPSSFREINIRGNQKEKRREQEQGDGRWEQLPELMQTCDFQMRRIKTLLEEGYGLTF